ncbi:FK506-binding protein 2-like [Glandiceps talaboti]
MSDGNVLSVFGIFLSILYLCDVLVEGVEIEGFSIIVTHRPDRCTHPAAYGDTVFFEYNGTLIDGTIFDSSYIWGEPFQYVIGDDDDSLIDGWVKGVEKMCIQEKRKITVPPNLGYHGNDLPASIPKNSTLIFDVKLVGLVKTVDKDSEYVRPQQQQKQQQPPSVNYEALQFLAIPCSVIIFVVVAVCLYFYEYRDKKVKWYRFGESV